MMRNVLSLFDGMSGCQLALKRLKIKIDNYYASEIHQPSIKVALHNFPKTIHLGDVRDIKSSSLPSIWLLTAGSPCTELSIAGDMEGFLGITSLKEYMKLKRNKHDFGKYQSYLFWEFIRIFKETKPKYFLFENVVLKGEMKKYERIITETLGVEPININSSLLCAQNRDRLYWTNIPDVFIPEDKGILSTDVIPKAYGAGRRGTKKKGETEYTSKFTVRTDGKFNCLVKSPHQTNLLYFPNGTIRKITPEEAEMIQTIPVGYTNVEGVSDTARYGMIGNGWTDVVIQHILKPLKSKK